MANISSGICATAFYFGDQLLHLRQIYKLVDSIFETITLISQEASDLSHDEFTNRLMKEPMVTELIATGPRRGKAVSFALSNNSIESDSTPSSESSASQEKCAIPQSTDVEGTSSSSNSIKASNSGSSVESSYSDDHDDENNKDLPEKYKVSPPVIPPCLGGATSSSVMSSQFSEGDASSLNPLKPITRISIHTGDENA